MSLRPDKSVLVAYRSKLGKVPDQQIADSAKVSRTLVVNYRKKLGIPPYQGHKPTVAAAQPASNKPFRGRRSALDAYVHILGTIPDSEIAEQAGVTAENVRTYRQRRGIEATWRVESPAAPARSAAQTAPSVVAPARPPASRGQVRSAAAPATAAPATAAPTESAPVAPVASVAPPATVTPAAVPAAVAAPSATPGMAYLVRIDTDTGTRSYALVAADIAEAAATASSRIARLYPGATIRAIEHVAELLPG